MLSELISCEKKFSAFCGLEFHRIFIPVYYVEECTKAKERETDFEAFVAVAVLQFPSFPRVLVGHQSMTRTKALALIRKCAFVCS